MKATLADFGIISITVGGLVSHGCVKATCLGGLAEGLEIGLLKNGHTNRNKDAQIKIITTENEICKHGILIQKIDNLNSN